MLLPYGLRGPMTPRHDPLCSRPQSPGGQGGIVERGAPREVMSTLQWALIGDYPGARGIPTVYGWFMT